MKEDLYNLYEKLDKYFYFDKANSIFITILKSIILLFSGGLFGFILKEYLSSGIVKWFPILVFLVLISIYVFFEFIRLSKEKNFPISILQHLKATEELQSSTKKIERQNKVYEFIDNSIRSLNSNTCPIAYGEPMNELCHQDLNNGLKSVLNDLVERTNYFFDVNKSKFSVGVYLDNARIKEGENIFQTSKNFIFRDDLKLENYLPLDLVHFNSENDFQFKILTKFLESINFSKFLDEKITIENKDLILICSPIPNVCEDCPPIGVVYTIYEGCEKCSYDSENVMMINGRLISNWISKYEDCLHRTYRNTLEESKTHQHNEIVIPKEVKELLEKQEQMRNNTNNSSSN
ncbi:hypothetical protein [Epilithonimonas sp.]|uniref:hypothetical protein n=1 Tax=Epilithonimonas sp. TaxID=2894511 RepID=UPI002FDCE9ED